MLTKPAIPPLYQSRSDTDIFRDLSRVMKLGDRELEAGYEENIRSMIRDLSITVEQLKASDLPIPVPEAEPLLPGKFLANGFPTPSGKFEFRSSVVARFEESHGLRAIPTWSEPLEDDGLAREYPFLLTTGSRLPNAIHSRLHEVPWARSMRREPTADINADDAAALGIRAGDSMEIYNAMGCLRVRANPSVKIRRGDVHLYHGYSEANANELVGMDHLDPYSGYPGYKSNRCGIRKAREQR